MQLGLVRSISTGCFRRSVVALLTLVALATASAATAQVNVAVGDLPSDGTITIEIVVSVDSPVPAGADLLSTQGTVSGGNFAAVATDDPAVGGGADPTLTNLDAVPELQIVKSDGGASSVPGGTIAYTLSFVNAGNQGASGVMLADTVPANTTFNAGASTGTWSCADGSPAGTPCALTVGGLAGGGNGSFVFAVNVVDPLPAGVTEISNTASIADDGANGADPNTGNNTSTDTTPLTAAPDLVVTKDDGGATAVPGGTVSYSIGYSNAGNQGATGVALSDTVPANTTFNAGASTGTWSCADGSPAGTLCTLDVGALAGGGAAGGETFAVDVVDPVAAGVDEISNTAAIADDLANGPDPNPGDNSATDTTPLTAAPDLAIVKDDGGASTVPGGTVSYTLSYSNGGNQGAVGVVLTDVVPAATALNAGASTPGWVCLPDPNPGSTCTLAVGALAAGTGGSATFAVNVVSPAPAGIDEISNTASVADDGTNGADPTPGDNSSTDTTPLAAVPDLAIDKSYTGPTPFPGDTIAFDLDYANNGSQGATGVEITETVPLATTFNAGASTAGWSCVPDPNPGSTCTLSIGALAGGGAGGSAVFAVDLDDPLPPGTSEVENTASIADDGANGADPTPGDNSDTETINLDVVPPTVTLVDTDASTADGELTECETVNVFVRGFEIAFSEPVQDPPGDTGPDDVTNPDNYLLVTPGPDFTYDTLICGGAAGDDVAVPIAAVTYDSGTDTAALDLGGFLANGLHRLLVCGSTSIVDIAGNPLDGNGDGTGGDDFVLSFRIDSANLFANGHFDCDAAEWLLAATAGATLAHDPAVDADGSPESGSAGAAVLAAGANPESAMASQCVAAFGNVDYDLAGRVRVAAAPNAFVALTAECELFSGAACAGGSLSTVGEATVLGDTAGAFVAVATSLTAPAGTTSAECRLIFDAPAGVTFDGWIDAGRLDGPIFADGFESGDTSAWSEVAP